MIADYLSLGCTLVLHPLSHLRERLGHWPVLKAEQLGTMKHGAEVRVAGLVTARQRPQTSKGVTFVTLEDESGQINIVVWPGLGERCNRALVDSFLMEVRGRVEHGTGLTHVIAQQLYDRTPLIGALRFGIHEFH